jgi:hypothetical protein
MKTCELKSRKRGLRAEPYLASGASRQRQRSIKIPKLWGHQTYPVRTFGRDALFLREFDPCVVVAGLVSRFGRVSGTNRWPTARCGMANDRLAGTYIDPDADGSRVRGEAVAHAPRAIADMYGLKVDEVERELRSKGAENK